MPNTPLGIPYPAPTDPISQGATAIQNVATFLDPKIRIAAGQVTIPISNAISGSANVTFPAGRFTSAPIVVAASQAMNLVASVAMGATTSGCTINLRNADNNTQTSNSVARWIAIQAW